MKHTLFQKGSRVLQLMLIAGLLIVFQACQSPADAPAEAEIPVDEVSAEPANLSSTGLPFERETIPSSLDSFPDEMHIYTFETEFFEEPFRLYVSIPASYEDNPDAEYPVLYVMEGNYDARTAATLVWNHNFDREVPEMIIVGIGYDLNEHDALRERAVADLLPYPTDGNEAGNAEETLAALKDEIMPFVEENYRIDPERAYLYGFFDSATFVLYALFEAPGLFTGYIANSPKHRGSGWSSSGAAEAYAEQFDDLDADLFISSAGSDFSNISFQEQMEEFGFENFNIKVVEIEDETVVGMAIVGMHRGIKEIFLSWRW